MSIHPILVSLLAVCAHAAPGSRDASGPQYLEGLRHRMVHVGQGWGELGINVCAHPAGQPGLPLEIGERTYQRGIGHHAPGEMVLELAGEYERFEAEIGVQRQPGGCGSVRFKVYADDELRFESGVMKGGEPPRPVSVPLAGVMELRLVVEDAGDGMTCDCANWAEARLIPSGRPPRATDAMDVAPFAEVITCDPARKDGARASRVEAFRAEDLRLETAVAKAHGVYPVPQYTSKQGQVACIGLKWPERRPLRALEIHFAGETVRPKAEDVRVECWAGESAWQGGWHRLKGVVEHLEDGFIFRPDWASVPEARGGTRKVRWIFAAASELRVSRLTAQVPGPFETARLAVQSLKSAGGEAIRLEPYNAEWVSPAAPAGELSREFAAASPANIELRTLKPRSWRSERSLLRCRVGSAAFAVDLDDVLRNGCVYVPHADVFISRADAGLTPEAYLARIRDQRSVLEEVRHAPDQTLAAAMAAVHNGAQDMSPTMLSLACDNRKFVVHRDGTVQFGIAPEEVGGILTVPLKFAHALRSRFGGGKAGGLKRQLDGGWLPAPVTELHEGAVTCRQRTYVVPSGTGQSSTDRPLCIVEYVLHNEGTSAAPVRLALTLTADSEKNIAGRLRSEGGLVIAEATGQILAMVRADAALSLELQAASGTAIYSGELAPGARVACTAALPGWGVTSPAAWPDGDTFARFEAYWRGLLAPCMQTELPDPLITNVIRASQVHCLMAARNEAEGQRIAAWAASINYGPLESESHSVIRGLDVWGHHEFARRALDFFIARYAPAGYLTTGYTLMGTGWHLWTLGQHYQLARDREWLQSVAPKVTKVCEWIVAQRAATRAAWSGRNGGLMPPGVMADWNAFAPYFCLNGYYCAGLRDVAAALADVGSPEAAALARDAEEFKGDILRAYRHTQSQSPVCRLRNGASVPAYPSQAGAAGPTNQFFPGEDGNRSWCYDVELGAHQLIAQGVLPARSQDADWIMDHMEDVQFLSDGWFDFPAERSRKDPFNFGGFSKVQPYYCRNGEIYALRDDVKPFIRSYFNTLCTLLNRENLSLQEHFHGVAAWNKTHETGYFLLHSRLMLVQERGEELWLAPFVTQNWMKDGMSISVRNAPTAFGPVSYTVTSRVASGVVDVEISAPQRSRPNAIVVRVRHPQGQAIKSAALDSGEQAEVVDADCIRFTTARKTVRLSVRY